MFLEPQLQLEMGRVHVCSLDYEHRETYLLSVSSRISQRKKRGQLLIRPSVPFFICKSVRPSRPQNITFDFIPNSRERANGWAGAVNLEKRQTQQSTTLV